MYISRALWSGLLSLAFAVVAAGSLEAQQADVYHNLGYGTEVGQAVIMIMPEGVSVGERGSNTAIEVSGSRTRTAAVGNCYPGEVTFQEVRVIERDGGGEPVSTEAAVIYPDNIRIPAGVQVGAWRPGGPCGDGYQIQRAHVLNSSY